MLWSLFGAVSVGAALIAACGACFAQGLEGRGEAPALGNAVPTEPVLVCPPSHPLPVDLVVSAGMPGPGRGRGAGRQLIEAACDHATGSDLRIVFDVMLKDAGAITLYESLGCRRIAATDHSHGADLSEPAAIYEAPVRPQ